tara:strand:- start:3302 stop:3757 length:456 start_codon:yes stop_codon:yes gene_type:complete
MKFSHEHKNIIKAFIKAKKEMSNPTKNKDNPFFKSKFADQSEVFNAVYPHLSNNGINMILEPNHIFDESTKQAFMTPTLVHESGEWILLQTVSIPITKGDAHAVAGAWTYLSRYILSLTFGLSADVDKDGNDTFTEDEQNKMNRYKRGTPQ